MTLSGHPLSLVPLAALFLSTSSGCAAQVDLDTRDSDAATTEGGTAARVSAKWGHVCRIDTEGRLSCWGNNFDGELGVPGAAAFEPTPRAVDPEHRYREVSAGVGTTCAIRREGSLYCWGRNHGGPLATGDTEPHDSPVRIGGDDDWEAVTMGSGMACGLRDGGRLFCWGGRDYGELAQPTLSPDALVAPTEIGGRWIAVSSHWYDTLGVREDGTLWTSENDGVFARAPSFEGRAAQVSVGVLHALVVDRDGALFHVRLGEPAMTPEVAGVAFGGAMASAYGSCSISAEGGMYCGSDLTYQTPQMEPLGDGLPRWTSVGVGNSFGCATAEDGSLWCWGTLGNDAGAPSVDYGPTPRRVD